MKKLSLLLMAVVLLAAASCKKDSSAQNNTQQALIVGKWNLQKQNVTLYVNGGLQSDSSFTTSNKTVSYVQFNKGGSFTAVSVYNSEGIGSTNLSSQPAVESVTGTYSFVGTAFSLSMPSIGSLSAPTITGISTTTLPVFHLVSQSAKIITLTSSAFTLHTEFTITETVNNNTQTNKTVQDSYYTR
ncbi:hypothetical protein KXD93_11805 [Mucilaginibacter sp. BJC16-A38]|uniref:hypothetical protein n=1 Tax=Mucilaginibacter phenanthrenivorans TaxID=1234842 RepID=UPI002158165A|nr:hypothetical protein [Mucilaginibacter phenanthrenivorans]MCR8558336.1 hypothetical protein [Mucilaginibacter phenanthrenivorans]